MSDKYDAQAEQLLPCNCGGPFSEQGWHLSCQVAGRPVVAEALRAQDAKAAQEIVELRAEIERLTQFIREVTVWVPGGGHTLGCECIAYWCARRKAILEAK